MRRVLLNALDEASASTMREIVREALLLRRAELEPRATAFVTSL